MNLQSKTSLVLILLLILAIAVVSVFVTVVSLASYSDLEHQYMVQDLDQARYRVAEESAALSAFVSDWAPWDDTCAFVNGDRPDYIASNLMPEPTVFNNLRLNLLLMADRQGDLVYARFYDSLNRTMVPVPSSITGPLTLQHPLMNMTDPTGVTSGLLMVEGRPMVVASRPVVRTDFSGAPQGVVIMGKYLEPDAVVAPARLTGHSLRFITIGDSELPASLLTALRTGAADSPGEVRTVDRETIAGYVLMQDIRGEDALVLRLTQPRSIHQQGAETIFQFILILLGIWLGTGVLGLFTLDRLVLSRVGVLQEQVRSAVHNADASRQIEIGGGDELSALAGDINRTLETIYTTQRRLLVSETRFREIADLLPQAIFELDPAGRLTYINKMGLETFGLTGDDLALHPRAETFVIPGDHERMFRTLQGVVGGEPSTGEIYTMIRRDGTRLRAVVNSAAIVESGVCLGIRGSIFDLSERLALEEALIESQDYLESLLFSVPAGILVVETETDLIADANPAALTMIGATREELVGQPCREIVRPSGAGAWPLSDEARLVLDAEGILVTCDGTERSIIRYVVPVTLKGRSCLLQTFMDNTERRQIGEELRQSTELITGVLQASPVGVCQLDSEGRYLFANEMFCRITGLTLDGIRGRYWADIIDPEDRDRLLAQLDGSIRDRQVTCGEARYIHPDGSVHWLYGQAVPLIDRPEQATDWVGTITDITERRTIEDALRESEEKYRALTENNPDVLFSADLDGVVTYVSPQVNQYGYLEEDLVGSSIFSIIHPDERPEIAAALIREITNTAQFGATFRINDRWGNVFWVEEKSFVRLDSFGRPIGIYGVLRDISERKRAEDAIELANKKLNLMNNITRHDILNTITGLLGCVDMANATDSAEERRALLQDIRHLTSQIQRQIAFTKEYQEVGVHLPRWQNVIETLRRVESVFERSGLEFVVDLENAEIYADPLLEKVFYNLVDNAIRYGEKVTTIRFYLLISDEGLTLVCEDDGVGIADERKQVVFERGVGKNTGMGLFLSREILGITRIGIVENGIPGEGARFEIFTPRGTYRFVI